MHPEQTCLYVTLTTFPRKIEFLCLACRCGLISLLSFVSVLCVLPGRTPNRAQWRFGPLLRCFLAGRQTPCSASQTEGWAAEWIWPASCTHCRNRPMNTCACHLCVQLSDIHSPLTWSDWCRCHRHREISASGPECGSRWWRWWSSPAWNQMKSCQAKCERTTTAFTPQLQPFLFAGLLLCYHIKPAATRTVVPGNLSFYTEEQRGGTMPGYNSYPQNSTIMLLILELIIICVYVWKKKLKSNLWKKYFGFTLDYSLFTQCVPTDTCWYKETGCDIGE